MADMDIAESRKPQDGHCAVTIGGHKLDFRVSTLPTVYGERVVLRILRKDSILLQLSDLGFLPDVARALRGVVHASRTARSSSPGPTGSGKSTSLYAAINVLNDPARHIITAEDPVEYRLPGVNQCQINTRPGLTFARALRSFLRCSPDVILVGEIRDQETAQIAIESALTGHLVLSTLHTNDAAGAVTRLIEMGVEPFLVSSAVDCVLGAAARAPAVPGLQAGVAPEAAKCSSTRATLPITSPRSSTAPAAARSAAARATAADSACTRC